MLQGKTALVTGGASGIGRAVAVLFAREGAQIALADINDTGGAETASLIEQAGGQSVYIHADVTKSAEVQQMVSTAIDTFGSLDIAVNNAGVFLHEGTPDELPENVWDQVIDVNLKGVWLCMRYEIPPMLHQAGGVILNMASVLGLRGAAEAAAYVAAKHGVIGLTKSAALAYAERGIRVNAICPGIIETPMEQELLDDPERLAPIMALYPMKRSGTPDEVAHMVLWLCSDAASYVTGAIVPVDGGHMAL